MKNAEEGDGLPTLEYRTQVLDWIAADGPHAVLEAVAEAFRIAANHLECSEEQARGLRKAAEDVEAVTGYVTDEAIE